MEIKNLNTKEKLLIINSSCDILENIYNSHKSNVINYITSQKSKSTQYNCDLGMFYLATSKAKNATQKLEDNTKKIKELQEKIRHLEEENLMLSTLDTNALVTTETIQLRSKSSEKASQYAKELLKPLINNLDSKVITNKYNKLEV